MSEHLKVVSRTFKGSVSSEEKPVSIRQPFVHIFLEVLKGKSSVSRMFKGSVSSEENPVSIREPFVHIFLEVLKGRGRVLGRNAAFQHGLCHGLDQNFRRAKLF